MPKIPWTPPKRPPRLKIEEPIADFSPVPQDERCDTCVGVGELYRVEPDKTLTPQACWVCNGTGNALPQPPDGALSGNGTFDPPAWSG